MMQADRLAQMWPNEEISTSRQVSGLDAIRPSARDDISHEQNRAVVKFFDSLTLLHRSVVQVSQAVQSEREARLETQLIAAQRVALANLQRARRAEAAVAEANDQIRTLTKFQMTVLRHHMVSEKGRDADRFAKLVAEWENERPRGVDVDAMAMHPSYQRIVGMGERALPLLLAQLSRRPRHWFWALHAITGENPVPPEAEGKLKEMAAAWLRWGKEHEYIGELD